MKSSTKTPSKPTSTPTADATSSASSTWSPIDVAIITKDRPQEIRRCVRRIRNCIPTRRLIVVDGAANPSDVEADVVHAPDALLGRARQLALEHAETSVIAFIDDDVTLAPSWYAHMYEALHSAEDIVAVNSRIVYGWQTNPVIEKLCNHGFRFAGGTVGVSLMKRDAILQLGGFNPHIHRGEDTELHLRIKQHGLRWIPQPDAVAYHPLSLRQFFQKAARNAEGWRTVWRHLPGRLRFIAERFASTLIMPIYYGWATRDPRVAGIYAAYKWRTLLAFLAKTR